MRIMRRRVPSSVYLQNKCKIFTAVLVYLLRPFIIIFFKFSILGEKKTLSRIPSQLK